MKYKSGILWVSLILLLVLGSSCGTSRKVPTWIPIRDVPMKNFGYNQKREVGVYVESGKDSVLDMVLTNVIELELMASGYKPVNLFKLIHPSVKSSREKARLSVDSVRTIAKTFTANSPASAGVATGTTSRAPFASACVIVEDARSTSITIAKDPRTSSSVHSFGVAKTRMFVTTSAQYGRL